MKSIIISFILIYGLLSEASGIVKSSDIISYGQSVQLEFVANELGLGESYFDHLSEKYKKAGTYNISSEKSRTARLGRCFLEGNKNQPIAAILLLEEVTDGAGPIEKPVLKISSIWRMGAANDYYDNMSYSAIRNDTHSIAIFTTYSLDPETGAMKAKVADLMSFLKADNKYVYEMLYDESNALFAACYYFKLVE